MLRYIHGSDLTAGCDCSGCVCSGWSPPESTYHQRFALAEGFSATEQVCFDRDQGKGEYTLLVTDDSTPMNIQWTLEGNIPDGTAHDVRELDFTTLESKDGCETPGERGDGGKGGKEKQALLKSPSLPLRPHYPNRP